MSIPGETRGTRAPFDPRRYHEQVAAERSEVAERPPVDTCGDSAVQIPKI